MAKRVVSEELQIDQNTTGVTRVVSVTTVDTEVASYTVPDNSELIIKPTDFFNFVGIVTGTTAIEDTAAVVLKLTDPMGRRTRVIASGQYAMFKEQQDSLKKYFMKQRVVVPANFLLKVMLKATAVASATLSSFALGCTNVYETLD